MLPNLRKRFTAYVVFQGAEHRRWWRIFTRRGWRHCYLVLPDHREGASLFSKPGSIVVNPWISCIRLDCLSRSPQDIAQEVLRDGATCVVKLAVDQKFTGRYVPRGLLTCVSMIKAMIGCNAWYVLTPEQLAMWMLRNGGELVERHENERTIRRPEGRQGSAGGTAQGE